MAEPDIDPKEHFRQHAAAKSRGEVLGADNIYRPKRLEIELDLLFNRVLNNPDGKRLVSYLRSFTLDAVAPAGVRNEDLQRLEGMRFMTQVIVNRTARGQK